MIQWLILGAVCAVVLFSSSALAQSQADSILEQQIMPFNCNYTTVATGRGMTHDSTCPHFSPKVEIIDSNDGRPIITGIYDAVHTLVLQIQIAEVWYTLGINAELTASGNVWVLDLSRLANRLPAGEHIISVKAEGDDGETRWAQASVVILPEVVVEPDDDEELEADPPRIGRLIDGVAEAPLPPLIAALIIGGGLTLFVTRRHHR